MSAPVFDIVVFAMTALCASLGLCFYGMYVNSGGVKSEDTAKMTFAHMVAHGVPQDTAARVSGYDDKTEVKK